MADCTTQNLETASPPSFQFGLRAQVTALVCVLVLATGGAVFYWTSTNYKTVLVEELFANVASEAALVSTRLSTEVKGFAQDVRFLAGTPPPQGIIQAQMRGGDGLYDESTVEQWKTRLATIFTELLKAKPEYFQMRVIAVAQHGREVLRVERQGEKIGRTPEAELQEKFEESYFKSTIPLPQGEVYFSDITLNREHGQITVPVIPALRVATPLHTPTGKVFGILIVNVDMSEIFSRLRHNLTVAQTLYIANSLGEFLVHPDEQQAFGFEYGASYQLKDFVPALTPWLTRTSQEGGNFPYTTSQGDSVIGLAKAQLNPADPRHYVTVAIQDSYQHVIARADAIQQDTIILSGAFFGMAFLGSLFFSRSLISPLTKFTAAAVAVGRGERNIRLPVDASGELGQLAMAFKTMATKIEERTMALERKENQFRQIVEAAPSGIVMVNQEGAMVLVNRLLTEQFGYATDEIIGQPLETLLSEQFQIEHVLHRENFFGSLETRRMGSARDLFGKHRDGAQFPVEVTLAPITTEEGAFVLAMVVDITERKQAKKALIESEARNRHILESAGEGIFGLDLNGCTTFINPAGATMLGYSCQELIGARMHALIHHTKSDGSPYSEDQCLISATFKDAMLYRNENETLWRKDGTSFPVAYSSSPMRDEHDNVIGAVVTFSDVTELKDTEQALLKRNQALKASNRELDDFAYIVSHDLKEPLRGIHNYSQIILDDHEEGLPDDARTKCETLVRLSQHMEALLDSLLYYSRDGRLELAVKPTDLDPVVKNILESLDVSLKERGMLVIIHQIFPILSCDRVRVGEIFRNLITNAMKYNDKSEKWIEIGYLEALSDISEPSTPLVFFVRDNGIGIREKHVDSVFRIFKRLNGRDKFGGGTGAGLTLTKKMVERHGGRIWVESIFGEGTTFYFTLAPSQGAEEPLVQNMAFSEMTMT